MTTERSIYNKCLIDISNEIYSVLKSILTQNELEETIKKLISYQYIDEVYKIQKGRIIKWIKKGGKLTNGAIVIDIKFLDTGTHILCKNNAGKINQLKFDNCIIFQKLSPEENLILAANDMISNIH